MPHVSLIGDIKIEYLSIPQGNSKSSCEYLEYGSSGEKSILIIQTPYTCNELKLTKENPRYTRLQLYTIDLDTIILSIRKTGVYVYIPPQDKMYSFLKNIDNKFEPIVRKNGGTYIPIIPIVGNKSGEVPTSCYFNLPGRWQLKPKYMNSQLITDLKSQNYWTSMATEKELRKETYYDYTPQFKLFEKKPGESNKEIKFNTFDELVSHMKHAKNIRFIIKLKLHCVCKQYIFKIEIIAIQINHNQVVKYNYDYDYIRKRVPLELIVATNEIRFKPENISQLIQEGSITSTHLFK